MDNMTNEVPYIYENCPLSLKNRFHLNNHDVLRAKEIVTISMNNNCAEVLANQDKNRKTGIIYWEYPHKVLRPFSLIFAKIYSFLANAFCLVLDMSLKSVSSSSNEAWNSSQNYGSNEESQNVIYQAATNDDSVIVVDAIEKETNVFESLLDIDQSAEVQSSQYGTNLFQNDNHMLLNSYNKHYLPTFDLSHLACNEELELFKRMEISKNNYDSTILKHYLPSKPISKLKYSIIDSLLSNLHIEVISDVYRQEKQRVQDLLDKQREVQKSKIEPLNNEQLTKILKIWKSRSNSLIVSNFQIDIFTRDLKTLDDNQWLNDNVIDYYFNLIMSDNNNIYGWTTHFYTTLQSKGYQGVSRWAKRRKINLTEKNLILIPINIMGTHWALAVVNNKSKKFQYFDSLTSNGNIQALEIIKNYMIQEGKRLSSTIDFENYAMLPNMKTPQQSNGYDCGVFTCTCAKFVSSEQPLAYGQKDMKIIRRRMAFEIIQQKLLS